MIGSIRKKKNITVIILFFLWLAAGCRQAETHQEPTWLIRAGESVMTVHDFNTAFDVHKSTYSYDLISDAEREKEIRLQFLKQMVERLTVFERARELKIAVSDGEMEKALADIRKNYPQGAFEESLLESAVSLQAWKAELKARLIMEKVIRKNIADKISVEKEEIEAARNRLKAEKTPKKVKNGKKSKDNNSKNNDKEQAKEMTVEQITAFLQREKTESMYDEWIKNLSKKYRIEIKDEEWQKIAGT